MTGRNFRSPLGGQVAIRVTGKQLERFLNLCESQQITLLDITADKSDSFCAVLSVEDFFRLQQARRKTHVHIRILQKSGIPFFLIRSRKRKAFVLGILCALLILFFFHSRIWQIRIEGNQMYSTSEILEYLDEQGIKPGIVSRHVSCSRIVESLRKQFLNITWASARKEGTGLFLVVREGTPEEEDRAETEICDLIAEEAGTIVKMVTRSGYPKMAPGDICEKGDTLVLGTFPILNDDQAVVRYESVHADADIYIEQELSYYREIPLTQERPAPTGDRRNSFFLHLQDLCFYPDFFWGKKTARKEADFWVTCRWEIPAAYGGNLKLPFRYGKETAYAYKIEKITFTKEEMEALLWQELQEYEENLLEKGLQISANNVTIRVDSRSGVSSGTLTVIRKIGKEVPITQRAKQPETERNHSESE